MCSSCMNPKKSCRKHRATFPACVKNQGFLPVSARPSHVVVTRSLFQACLQLLKLLKQGDFLRSAWQFFSNFLSFNNGLFQTSMTDDFVFFLVKSLEVILPINHWAVSSFFWFDFRVLSLRRHTNIPKFSWFCCTLFFLFCFFPQQIRHQRTTSSPKWNVILWFPEVTTRRWTWSLTLQLFECGF